MGHFKDAHRTCPTSVGQNRNCTFPVENVLQVIYLFNHANGPGLIQDNLPACKKQASRPAMRRPSVPSKSLPLLLAAFAAVVQMSSAALAMLDSTGRSVATQHGHRHPSHGLAADLSSQTLQLLPLSNVSYLNVPRSDSILLPSPTSLLPLASDLTHSSSSPSSFAALQVSPSPLGPSDPLALNSKLPRSVHPTECNRNRPQTTGKLNCTLTADKLIDAASQSGHTTATNGSSSSDVYNSSWNIHIIWYTIFGGMIIVGLVANLLIVATIGGHKSLHTITNVFLLNLTVSDLLTLIFNANFNLYFLLTGHWPFGRVFCVVNNFISNLTIFSSVCTIMFTSKERYNAIVHPLRKRMTKQRAFVHIFIIWSGATLFAVPTLVFSHTLHVRVPLGQKKGEIDRTVCLLKWPDGYPWQSRLDFIYNLLFLVLTYILPLLTMAIAYTLMARVLWGSKQIGESTQAQMNLVHSKQKVVRMLIMVTVLFGCCWLPYHIYFLCTYQWPWLVSAKATQHIYLAIYWLAMSNSMLNPIILLLMNQRFRRYSTKFLNFWPFIQMFPCIVAAQQSLPSETCNTAIVVTQGPNHQETQTVLLTNGLRSHSPIDENGCAYENGHNGKHKSYLRKESSQKSTRPLVASMSVRYSP